MSKCNNCGENNKSVSQISTYIQVTENKSEDCKECRESVFREKLGKCKKCIAITIFGFIVFWLLYILISDRIYSFFLFIIAICFSTFFLAHISAFVYRKINR